MNRITLENLSAGTTAFLLFVEPWQNTVNNACTIIHFIGAQGGYDVELAAANRMIETGRTRFLTRHGECMIVKIERIDR